MPSNATKATEHEYTTWQPMICAKSEKKTEKAKHECTTWQRQSMICGSLIGGMGEWIRESICHYLRPEPYMGLGMGKSLHPVTLQLTKCNRTGRAFCVRASSNVTYLTPDVSIMLACALSGWLKLPFLHSKQSVQPSWICAWLYTLSDRVTVCVFLPAYDSSDLRARLCCRILSPASFFA